MKYAVEQKYFNSGKVKVCIKEVGDYCENVSRTNNTHDLYVDVFDTKKEAQECLKLALNT